MASHTVFVSLAVIFSLLALSYESEGRQVVRSDDSVPRYRGNLPIKTLAMRPSSYPHKKDIKGNLDDMSADIFRTSLTPVNCPYGTIPILRPMEHSPELLEYKHSQKRNPIQSKIVF
ncbi:uncharacterized protein LOC116262941 isoform X2 [Nymphaea colorata]|uniref:uncharacterized protein LOC116262941 isoform X2 n=1 Tax=Nymphaea colorata TaxID=210225 RepID=UPI00129DFF72|nr:uncharacterized protein LOC116262941 isoform X2 [Nymphaea colorata]